RRRRGLHERLRRDGGPARVGVRGWCLHAGGPGDLQVNERPRQLVDEGPTLVISARAARTAETRQESHTLSEDPYSAESPKTSKRPSGYAILTVFLVLVPLSTCAG